MFKMHLERSLGMSSATVHLRLPLKENQQKVAYSQPWLLSHRAWLPLTNQGCLEKVKIFAYDKKVQVTKLLSMFTTDHLNDSLSIGSYMIIWSFLLPRSTTLCPMRSNDIQRRGRAQDLYTPFNQWCKVVLARQLNNLLGSSSYLKLESAGNSTSYPQARPYKSGE